MDEEIRARVEALELVAVIQLAAKMSPRKLTELIRRQSLEVRRREKLADLPSIGRQADPARGHHMRLLRLALQESQIARGDHAASSG